MGAFSAPIFASDIQLGINGDVKIGSNFSYIDFGQMEYDNGGPYVKPPEYGTFEVSAVYRGYFKSLGVTAGDLGEIQSLNNETGSVTLPGAFMKFDVGSSVISLFATNIPAGTNGLLTLENSPLGAFAAFDVSGYVTDSSNPNLNRTFTGVFSMTFDGKTVNELSRCLPTDTPFSATLSTMDTASAPEPGSLLLMGAGCLGLGAVARRRMRKS